MSEVVEGCVTTPLCQRTRRLPTVHSASSAMDVNVTLPRPGKSASTGLANPTLAPGVAAINVTTVTYGEP